MSRSRSIAVTFKVNQREVSIDSPPGRSLLEALREDLHLTGTKYGCGEAQCGACSVLIDGRKTFSCVTPIEQAQGRSVVTIEGLADGETLHPAQQAFLDAEAFQCGYCTPGMIVATVALLERKPHLNDDDIDGALGGHICRCCGYTRIREAVRQAAAKAGQQP